MKFIIKKLEILYKIMNYQILSNPSQKKYYRIKLYEKF